MRLLARTLRACDSKVLISAESDYTCLIAIAERAFCDTDVLILKNSIVNGSFVQMLTRLASGMSHRYAFLVLNKGGDGKLDSVQLVSHAGNVEVAHENVTRYVLCPWVLPIVLDQRFVIEVKVQGIAREQFRLTDVTRVRALHECQQAVPEEFKEFMRDAKRGLNAIPEMLQKLDAVQAQLLAGVPVSPTTAARGVGSSLAPAPPREMSETQRSFKRMIAQIEAYARLWSDARRLASQSVNNNGCDGGNERTRR